LRGLGPGAALFARTVRIGKFWGIEPVPTMTPREYANAFARAVPRAAKPVSYVAGLYEAERYGGVSITEESRAGGDRAWRSVRAVMLRWRPWRRNPRRSR
jgi:hypothetical protein